MHYYQHNIGDYRRDTAHLSLLEHGVYRQLIDMYYLHEQPIPTEAQQVFRRLCARTQEEQSAVEVILKEFFVLTEDGWRHKRCDEEIENFLIQDEDNRAREENEKERQRRHREERKRLFADLRAKGVIPSWDILIEPLRKLHKQHCDIVVTDQQSACNAPETLQERFCNEPATAITNNHKPRTINQEPLTINQEPLKTFTPPPNPPEGGSAVLEDSGSIEPSSSSPVVGSAAETQKNCEKIAEKSPENGEKLETDARNRPKNTEESITNGETPSENGGEYLEADARNPSTKHEKSTTGLAVVNIENHLSMQVLDKKPDAKPRNRSSPESPTGETWTAYAAAYSQRYGVTPVRNATVNGQLAQFVKRIGKDEAPHVAMFFVWHNAQFYVKKMHAVGVMLADAEKLRTEWATNRSMTETQARQTDQTQARGNVYQQVMEEFRREGKA